MTRFSERGAVARPLLIGITVVLLIVVVFGLWLIMGPGPMDFAGGKRVSVASTSGPGPTGVPTELANASLIERGQYLTRAADCVACHTKDGGEPFAGGRPFVLPFGTMYSTNITPDKKTGIGEYSDAEFLRAMHNGIARDGTRLYPAMPYASYTYMTDADALAIKAYLFSLQPVDSPRPTNTLSFPFNQRWMMGMWSAFFNPDKRFEPNTERSAEWNRGAYLAEAMAHCGECHTPRNSLGAPETGHSFAGAQLAGADGNYAPNITPDVAHGIGKWSLDDIANVLKLGLTPDGSPVEAPMSEVVDGTSKLTDADRSAIAVYLKSVPALPDHRDKAQP
jgi:mono/diheme cytochrome c family protein